MAAKAATKGASKGRAGKKTKKAVKIAPDKTARWTVRGVPARLQRLAGDVARARGQTLGQWLSEVVEHAVSQAPEGPTAAAAEWRDSIEARLARLEQTLVVAEAKGPLSPAEESATAA